MDNMLSLHRSRESMAPMSPLRGVVDNMLSLHRSRESMAPMSPLRGVVDNMLSLHRSRESMAPRSGYAWCDWDWAGCGGGHPRWVPCFRGSFAVAKSMQNHRESMRTLRGLHAFAVMSPAIRFCKGAAKAWHQ